MCAPRGLAIVLGQKPRSLPRTGRPWWLHHAPACQGDSPTGAHVLHGRMSYKGACLHGHLSTQVRGHFFFSFREFVSDVNQKSLPSKYFVKEEERKTRGRSTKLEEDSHCRRDDGLM